mmetsp:Transcript_116802/g.330462  ORF Transcript_116802/g.330462 Transcript_116802/m.330462 type:complete len:226 (-) Transcript_116802:613-1290(-)
MVSCVITRSPRSCVITRSTPMPVAMGADVKSRTPLEFNAGGPSVAFALALGAGSSWPLLLPPPTFAEPPVLPMRSMTSIGVLQTGHCLSQIRCLSMLQWRPWEESMSPPTTWKMCMHGRRRTFSPTWKVSKQIGQASRCNAKSASPTAMAKVFAVIISCVAKGRSRGSTMCMTQATMDVYHILSVCAISRRPHVCGVSPGTSTSYSKVKTLLRPAPPPDPHFNRV